MPRQSELSELRITLGRDYATAEHLIPLFDRGFNTRYFLVDLGDGVLAVAHPQRERTRAHPAQDDQGALVVQHGLRDLLRLEADPGTNPRQPAAEARWEHCAASPATRRGRAHRCGWAWLGHTVFATRFDTDDVAQRALTLVQVFIVAVMGINAGGALDSRDSAGFAGAYAALRLVLVAQYVRARRLRESRPLSTHYLVGCSTAALLWLVSALVSAPARFWLWVFAFVLDLATPIAAERHSGRVPPHASHLPERFGLFTIILLGESVLAVMQGMRSQDTWSPGAAVSAFASLALLFLLWWWYFDHAGGAEERHVRSEADALHLRGCDRCDGTTGSGRRPRDPGNADQQLPTLAASRKRSYRLTLLSHLHAAFRPQIEDPPGLRHRRQRGL